MSTATDRRIAEGLCTHPILRKEYIVGIETGNRFCLSCGEEVMPHVLPERTASIDIGGPPARKAPF